MVPTPAMLSSGMPRLQPRGFHHGNNDEEKEMTAAATALAIGLDDVNSHHHGANHSKIHSHDCSQTTLEMLHREEHDGSESTTSDTEEVVRPTTDVNRPAPSHHHQPQPHHYHCDWQPQQVARFSWDFFCSFLVPLLAQFIFGGFSIVRTLVLGYTLQNAVREVLPAFLTTSAEKSMMGGCSSSSSTPFHHHGTIPSWLSTPPPALVVLALLTVVAFVIHPDGFTWILLRKLRDGLLFVMESSSTCWAVVVNDYGTIVASILAMLTFAGLMALVFVMHRTLTSKTPQHKARHPQSLLSDKQKRKKRRNKTKGRIRTSTAAAAATTTTPLHVRSLRDAEDEVLLADESWTRMEQEQAVAPSVLPPLVEDKPMLDTINVRTVPQFVETTTTTRLRSDSVDSNFEDASSCETSVSSISVATTPNRLPNETLEQQKDFYQPVNNARGRLKTTRSESRRGQAVVGTSSSRPVKSDNETLKVSGSSRWDALKPETRLAPERFAPPQRNSSRSGRNEARSQRPPWKKQSSNNKKQQASPPSFVEPVERRPAAFPAPLGMDETISNVPLSMTATLPAAFATAPNLTVEDGGAPQGYLRTAFSAAPSPVPFLPPPPGLIPPSNKAIPFGCGSSDGGCSAPPSPCFYEPTSYLNIQAPRFQPTSFGAIGPAFPSPGSGDGRTETAHGCLIDSSFDATSISFRSSGAPFGATAAAGNNNPFASSSGAVPNNDDDTIEAQLQELGGQMVCSILDF